MHHISSENSSQINISKENQIDFQRIYSQTIPINNLQTDHQETNNINNHSDYIYQTTVPKNFKYLKNDNNNIPTITHNETSLVKNLQFLDEDNIKLREAMSELNLELKEKEEALNESQKLLKKINNEYTQMVKEFKKLEDERNLYHEENEKNKKMLENMNKNFNEYDKIVKQNEQLKADLIKNKEIMNSLKGNYSNVANDFNKIEKDNKIKEIIIKDLQLEGNKIINMLQDRDLLIETYSKKISELNGIIKQKDEQLKLMINFSKEINNGNKNNVKEITKQAVKTIKVFYNIRNNKDNPNQINFVEIIKSEKDNNINKNNISDIIFGNFNNINDKKIKCGFLLNEAIQNVLYIPDIGINHINKEFLIDNNFKTCLLKTELFSSIIRETEFISFLSNFISKLNVGFSIFNSPLSNRKDKNIGENLKKFSNIKIYYDKMNKSAIKYKRENSILKRKLNELILYINKLKKDFYEKIQKFKEKVKNLDKNYNLYINELEQKYSDVQNMEEVNTPLDDKSKKLSKLYLEIDKIKNMNNNLNEEIKEKGEIITKLKDENNQLLIKLNAFRTNPNAENNYKYYNSFTINDNNINKKKLSRNLHEQNNIDLSDISNNYMKYNTNKVSFSNNDNIFDNSINENLSNNSMKYSTKATSKNLTMNKKKNIKNFIRNLNDLSNYNFNENDITNVFIKSNNATNASFINLQIEEQESFNYLINKKTQIKNNYINNNLELEKNSKLFEQEILKNIFTLINEFKSEIKEEKFLDLVNKNFQIPKIIQLLINKIEDIKINLSNIKQKFKNNHKDKKIKPTHLIEIMEQVEKLLLYVNNHLNKTNNDILNIHPYMQFIFDLVSKIAYDSPLSYYNNTCDITPITIGINTLQNTSTIILNNKNTIKDNILKNNNITSKITNQEIEDINNFNNNSLGTKESFFPNFKELKKFFDINNKIFSSSELIKYKTIYEGLPISKLLKVFKDICDNLKKTIHNSKNEYDSDWSDVEENHTETKTSLIFTDNNSYHLVNQKIFGLKKFEFNYKIFMELIKNYLVTFEIILNQLEFEINNKNKTKQIKLGEELNILYNIFEDAVYYKMDKLDDDIIFNRKILLKLLFNHKEYLSIIYDI